MSSLDGFKYSAKRSTKRSSLEGHDALQLRHERHLYIEMLRRRQDSDGYCRATEAIEVPRGCLLGDVCFGNSSLQE